MKNKVQEVLIPSRTLHKHDDILSNSSFFFRGWGVVGFCEDTLSAFLFWIWWGRLNNSEQAGTQSVFVSSLLLSDSFMSQSFLVFSSCSCSLETHRQMLLSCCLLIIISVCWRDCSGLLLCGVVWCLSNRESVTGSRWWSAWPLFGESGCGAGWAQLVEYEPQRQSP